MNGALFRARIFCRLYLNARLEFPALCSAVSHAKTNNTCCQWFPPPEAALVLYNDSRTILNHSSNRCNTENYRHGFLPITDSSANQLSVPINRQNRLIGLPLLSITQLLMTIFLYPLIMFIVWMAHFVVDLWPVWQLYLDLSAC